MAVTRKIKSGEKRGYGCSEKGNANEPQHNEYVFNKLSVVMKSQTVLPLKVLQMYLYSKLSDEAKLYSSQLDFIIVRSDCCNNGTFCVIPIINAHPELRNVNQYSLL